MLKFADRAINHALVIVTDCGATRGWRRRIDEEAYAVLFARQKLYMMLPEPIDQHVGDILFPFHIRAHLSNAGGLSRTQQVSPKKGRAEIDAPSA